MVRRPSISSPGRRGDDRRPAVCCPRRSSPFGAGRPARRPSPELRGVGSGHRVGAARSRRRRVVERSVAVEIPGVRDQSCLSGPSEPEPSKLTVSGTGAGPGRRSPERRRPVAAVSTSRIMPPYGSREVHVVEVCRSGRYWRSTGSLAPREGAARLAGSGCRRAVHGPMQCRDWSRRRARRPRTRVCPSRPKAELRPPR